MAFAGILNFNTNINQSGFNQGTSALTKASAKLGMAVAAGFALAGVALVAFGKKAVQLASDLQEVQNVVDTVFGNMAKDIDEFSKTTLDKFGLSELSAKRYASTLGAMLKPTGLATGQITEMAKTLTGATGGMASFFNRSAEVINQDIQSYFAGSSETMYKYGLIATVANMETFALSQGITKLWRDMSQAEQQTLRYNFLVQNLGYTFNDFSKTIDSHANQTRLLSERWNEFLTLIGGQFLQTLTPVVKMLNTLLSGLINATKQWIKFYSVLTGSPIKDSGMADTVKVTSDSIGSANNNQKALNKSMATGAKASQKAAKAQEDANKASEGQLASFDKVNVISEKIAENASSSAGSGDIGGSSGAGFDLSNAGIGSLSGEIGSDVTLNPVLEKLITIISEIKAGFEALRTIDLTPFFESFSPLMNIDWEPIKLGLSAMANGFLTLTESVANNLLAPFVTNVLVPFYDKMIEGVIPAGLKLIGAEFEYVGTVLENQKKNFEFIFKIIGAIAGFVLDGIIFAFNMLTKAIKALNSFAKENPKIFDSIVTVLLVVISTFLLVEGALRVYAIVMAIATAVTTGFATVMGILTSPIILVIAAIAAVIAIGVLLYKNWDVIKEKALQFWEYLVKLFTPVALWFDENVVKPIVVLFTSIWTKTKEIFKSVYDSIKEIVLPIVLWFNESIIKPILTLWGEFKTLISEVITQAWDIVKAIFLTVVAYVELFVIAPLLEKWETFKTDIKTKWDAIITVFEEVWGAISTYVKEKVIDPILEKWGEIKEKLKPIWDKVMNVLHVAFAHFINAQISGFETFINFFVKGVNTMIGAMNKLKFVVPDWVPNIGGKSFGFNLNTLNEVKFGRMEVPKLATGAVIPPNSQFMAILGDQKSGINIETPLATMIQAFETALGNKGTTDINVNFTGNMAQLIRVLKPEIEKEDRRVGRRKVSIA